MIKKMRIIYGPHTREIEQLLYRYQSICNLDIVQVVNHIDKQF